MTWYPIAFMPPQYEDGSGAPYSGAVLKAYEPSTSNPLPMATDNTGATTSASFVLNASGYPTYGGNIVIPYLQENYDLALYPSQAAADANSGAIWTVPNIPIAEDTNEPFAEYFDGGTDTFALSEDLGNDARVLLVFADKPLPNYATGGDFSTPSDWTAGANWSIASGTATATTASADLSQNAAFPFLQGHSYTVTYTITRSAGDITPKIGGASGTTRSSAGTYTETIIAGSTQVIAFTGNGFTGTVDNVSVKPTYAAKRELVRPDEMTLTGNQLVLNFVPPSGTKAVAVFAPSLAIGAANNAAAAAATSETNCANSESAVQALRDEIFSSSFVLYGTSATSLTIGTGSKVFTTQAGKQWVLGQRLRAASDDGTMIMEGEVTDYTGTSLTLDVDYTEGAGTHADWNIGVAGAQGAAGVSGSNGTRNKVFNGDMNVALKGASFAAIANGAESLSRWKVSHSTAGVVTVSQQADAPSNNEFLNSLRVAVTTADASVAAGDYFTVAQYLEGYNARDLIGRDFTISFWVRSAKTGVHAVALSNRGNDRHYVSTYTINAANAWEYKTITVTGGLITAGTWDWTNGVGLRLDFTLMAGSTYNTATAGVWATGNLFATSAQVNVLDTISNIWAVTGVQLEAGSSATDFEHRPIYIEETLSSNYVTQTSSTKTPGATNNWLAMTGSTITLPVGRWKLEGSADFGNNGSVASYFDCRLKWASANGADSSTEPADLASSGNITVVSAPAARATAYSQTGTGSTALDGGCALPIIIDVANAATPIYLVPYLQATNPTNARITANIIATKLTKVL